LEQRGTSVNQILAGFSG